MIEYKACAKAPHRNKFITTIKFMHGDADFYTTETYWTITEQETEDLWALLRMLLRQRKYHRLGGWDNQDEMLKELIETSPAFVKTFYSDEVLEWYKEDNSTESLDEYLIKRCDLNWPIDKTNYSDPTALESWETVWYNEHGDKFLVKVVE